MPILALGTGSYPKNGNKQQATTSTDQCVAKLRAFKLDAGSSSDKSVSEETDKREKADLCQQIRMADAAEEAAGTAWSQYVVSVLGLAGLFFTVIFTAIAAFSALRAARSANATVLAMQQSERRELRAYVGLERIELEIRSAEEGYVPNAAAQPGTIYHDLLATTVKNYGQTPAYNVSVYCGVLSMPFLGRLERGADFDVRLHQNRPGGNIVTRALINNGQSETIKSGLFDVRAIWRAQRRECTIMVYGHI